MTVLIGILLALYFGYRTIEEISDYNYWYAAVLGIFCFASVALTLTAIASGA